VLYRRIWARTPGLARYRRCIGPGHGGIPAPAGALPCSGVLYRRIWARMPRLARYRRRIGPAAVPTTGDAHAGPRMGIDPVRE